MSQQNLESVLKAAGNPVQMLRNSKVGAYVYPGVPGEFSNWMDEQRAWRESAVLFDQSHHMAELTVKGPDALKLISYTTINSFNNFQVNKAKQMVPVSYDGYVIGDGILFYLDKDELLFVGRAPSVNWIQFHGETGGFKVDMIRDDRSPGDPKGKAITRRHYRYQVQGPNAEKVLNKLNGGPIPDVKFFTMDAINIGGKRVRALRHGMAGAPGLELWGPYEEREFIRDTILKAGEEFGLRAGRLARLCLEYAGVGLDSVAAAGRVHRREDEEVPRVAAGERATKPPAPSAAASSRTTSKTTT